MIDLRIFLLILLLIKPLHNLLSSLIQAMFTSESYQDNTQTFVFTSKLIPICIDTNRRVLWQPRRHRKTANRTRKNHFVSGLLSFVDAPARPFRYRLVVQV